MGTVGLELILSETRRQRKPELVGVHLSKQLGFGVRESQVWTLAVWADGSWQCFMGVDGGPTAAFSGTAQGTQRSRGQSQGQKLWWPRWRKRNRLPVCPGHSPTVHLLLQTCRRLEEGLCQAERPAGKRTAFRKELDPGAQWGNDPFPAEVSARPPLGEILLDRTAPQGLVTPSS